MSSAGQLVPEVTRSPPNMTIKFSGPHVEESLCTPINVNYDPVTSVLCAMYIAFGIVYTLFGYRCFKATMFLTGFTFGSAVVYLICIQEYLMPPYGNVGVALCAGLLFGLITMLIQYVGLFMTGFHTGVLLAIAELAIYDHFLDSRPTTYWLCVVVLLCSGIFFAVVNLYWKKVLTIFGTSVYGGAVIATSLDYFLERMIMLKWIIIFDLFFIIITIFIIDMNIFSVAERHPLLSIEPQKGLQRHFLRHSYPADFPGRYQAKRRRSRVLSIKAITVTQNTQERFGPNGLPFYEQSTCLTLIFVVATCETGASRRTTLPFIVAYARRLASRRHRGPYRTICPYRDWDLPRAEHQRAEATHEGSTSSADHPRAADGDETKKIQIPVPGSHSAWGCHLSVVRTSSAKEGSVRELEWYRRGRVQHSPERLDPPYGIGRIRGRPTYRQRRRPEPDSSGSLNTNFSSK